MSETREFDGPNWRDNPDEYKPPVRGSGSFLASRGYENPEIAAVKFGLAEDNSPRRGATAYYPGRRRNAGHRGRRSAIAA